MAEIAIAAAISGGGMALQYLMRPRVDQTPVDKGKFDDIRLVGSDYGAFGVRSVSAATLYLRPALTTK